MIHVCRDNPANKSHGFTETLIQLLISSSCLPQSIDGQLKAPSAVTLNLGMRIPKVKVVLFYFFSPSESSRLQIASERGNEVSKGDLTGGGCGERAAERGRQSFLSPSESWGGGGGDVGVKGDMQRSGWRRKISPKKVNLLKIAPKM